LGCPGFKTRNRKNENGDNCVRDFTKCSLDVTYEQKIYRDNLKQEASKI